MIALEHARGLCLTEDARACSDELLVEVALVVAAVPVLAVQHFQRAPAFLDSVQCAHAAAHGSSPHELLHGAERVLGGRGMTTRLVCVVQVLERQHWWRGV